MALLSEREFRATFGDRMSELSPRALPPVRLGSYLDAIPGEDYAGHDFSERLVVSLRAAHGHPWVHVLLRSKTPNLYLVLVIDRNTTRVHGHRLLDLAPLVDADPD